MNFATARLAPGHGFGIIIATNAAGSNATRATQAAFEQLIELAARREKAKQEGR